MHPRALLERFGYRPKKRLGQHFLIDPSAAERIAGLVCESPPAAAPSVAEIGPGTGCLTAALLRRHARVAAIDIDEDMIRILRSQDELAVAEIVHADALAYDYSAFAGGGPWRVAGNLPYNIATPLVMRFVEMRHGPETIVVMVQKDVANRFAARPATRAYGSLSVAVQYAMDVQSAFTLPASAFYPRPKVESTVVRLRRRNLPAVHVDNEARFLQVVRAAFAYRRKTLANSLSLALGMERKAVAKTLAQLGFRSEIRGEQLDLDDFARLANGLRA